MSAFDSFGNYAGLANAQNQFNQNQAFFNQQQNMANYAQNAWQGVTGNLTQDPAFYAAQGIAYQGQIGPVAAPGTYTGIWAGRGGSAPAASSGGGDIWSQGTSPIDYPDAQQTWSDQMNLMDQLRFGRGFTSTPTQTPQVSQGPQPFAADSTPYGFGYDPNRFMPSSTPFETYGQPGVGGTGTPPPVGQGYDQAAMWGYLQANPDVLQAAQGSGQDIFSFANQHLNNYGRSENRSLGDAGGFDAAKSTYLQNNPDVAASGMDAYTHWNQFGRKEGRSFGDMAGGLVGPGGSASAGATDQGQVTGGGSGSGAALSFGQQYLQANPDVAAAKPAGMSDDQWAQQHYQQYGQNEGRGDFGMRDQIAQQLMFNDRWGNTPYIAGPGYKLPGIITDGVPNTGNTPFEQRWADMDPNPDATPYPGGFEDRWSGVPAYDPNSFANRFGDFPRAADPSQYYTGGEYGPPAQMPPGFNNGTYPGMPSRDTLGPGDYFPAPAGGQSYLQNNPDVAAAGMDPWTHYQQFGKAEGRSWPVVAAGEQSFNDRWADQYGDQSMYNFDSPANGYDTFQKWASGNTATGDASTYNPYFPGYRTGGAQNASGGTYDPNGYHAAIQQSLRNQFGGVPYGKQPGQAVVQGPGGMQAIVDINNVGPLTQGRIIDLSTKAMQYFNPSAGPNRGLLPNVAVTSLPYGTSYPTGPTGPVGPYGPMQPTPGVPLPMDYGARPRTPTSGWVVPR